MEPCGSPPTAAKAPHDGARQAIQRLPPRLDLKVASVVEAPEEASPPPAMPRRRPAATPQRARGCSSGTRLAWLSLRELVDVESPRVIVCPPACPGEGRLPEYVEAGGVSTSRHWDEGVAWGGPYLGKVCVCVQIRFGCMWRAPSRGGRTVWFLEHGSEVSAWGRPNICRLLRPHRELAFSLRTEAERVGEGASFFHRRGGSIAMI